VHTFIVEYEWDRAKAAANLKKHGVRFADAVLALEDPAALTMPDPDSTGEPRFVCLGVDSMGRVLVTVFTYRGGKIRIISSRKASRSERRNYENS
jgi:uncharacterized DUF497 family protein